LVLIFIQEILTSVIWINKKLGGWEALIDRSLEDEKIRRYDGECRKRHINAKGIAQGAE